MAKKIKWSIRARKERFEILKYWANRNKSKVYSAKLNQEFLDTIELVKKTPFIGIAVDKRNVRFIITGNYLIYYLISDAYIEIITIWDSRRNPQKFKL